MSQDVQLAPKLVLAAKTVATLTVEQLRIKLYWNNGQAAADQVDFDLMAFYKTTDGRLGGVFSDNMPCGYLGDKDAFPFIQLDGDDGVAGDDGSVGPQEETMLVTRLDHIEELYIVALNYTDASQGRSRTFAQLNGGITIASNSPAGVDHHDLPLNGTQPGVAAIVAKIDGPAGAKKLTNVSRVVSLQGLFAEVPASVLLTKLNPSDAVKGLLP